MFDFHEKRKIRNILYSKVSIVVLFAVAIFISVSVYNRYTVAREMGKKLEAKQEELESLRQRAGVLDAKVKYLEDERGVEEELRNRFDVVREGEQTVILIDPKEDTSKQKQRGLGGEAMPIDSTPEEETFLESLKFWRSEN